MKPNLTSQLPPNLLNFYNQDPTFHALVTMHIVQESTYQVMLEEALLFFLTERNKIRNATLLEARQAIPVVYGTRK